MHGYGRIALGMLVLSASIFHEHTLLSIKHVLLLYHLTYLRFKKNVTH